MPSSVADRGPFDRVGVVEVAPRRGAGHRPFHGGGQGRCDILVHRPPRHGAGRGRIGARRCGDCRGCPVLCGRASSRRRRPADGGHAAPPNGCMAPSTSSRRRRTRRVPERYPRRRPSAIIWRTVRSVTARYSAASLIVMYRRDNGERLPCRAFRSRERPSTRDSATGTRTCAHRKIYPPSWLKRKHNALNGITCRASAIDGSSASGMVDVLSS